MFRATLFLGLAGLLLTGCSSAWKASDLSGIRTRAVTDEDMSQFGYKSGSGVVIRSVDDDSDAFAKGARENDLITTVNGNQVGNSADYENAVIQAGHDADLSLGLTDPNGKNRKVTFKTVSGEERPDWNFGVSLPFLYYQGPEDSSIVHLSAFRIPRKDSGKKGLMVLELLGYIKKGDRWVARFLFFTFGTGDFVP